MYTDNTGVKEFTTYYSKGTRGEPWVAMYAHIDGKEVFVANMPADHPVVASERAKLESQRFTFVAWADYSAKEGWRQ